MNRHTVTYAQNREDIILQAFFDRDEEGFYIDVGAEAPTELSVTKIFYDSGWRGINIEPIKRQYELFVKERPRDINLNIGISNKNGSLNFREYEGSGYSTFSQNIKKEHASDDEALVKEYTDYKVEVRTLRSVLEDHKVSHVHFLKIDVEGLEYEVLSSNDWEKYRPEVICIEANHVIKDWRRLLVDKGYSLTFFDGLNEYYTDDSTNRAERFNYVQDVILREPIVSHHVVEEIKQYEKHVKWVEETNEKLVKEQTILRAEVQQLQNLLNEVMPFRRHALRQLKHLLKKMDTRIVNRLTDQRVYVPTELPVSETSTKEELLQRAREHDRRELRHFTTPLKNSPLLPAYVGVRTWTRKFTRGVLRKVLG